MESQSPKAAESQQALDELLVAPEAEPAFDDLASLAAWVCGAPVGLIAIRDKKDPWLKAAPGLPSSASELALSLCAKTLAGDKAL